MKKWYKSEMFWAAVIFVLFLMAIPFLINESYKDGSGYVTLWNAADALSFYGSVLSLIGTVVLGLIAIWQNKKANEINDKLLELTRKEKFGYLFPKDRLKVMGNSIRYVDYPHNISKPGISLIGHGDDNLFLSKIIYTVNGNQIREENIELFVTCEGEFNKLYFPIRLSDAEKELNTIDVKMMISLSNSKSYKYIQLLYLSFKKIREEEYAVIAFNTRFVDDIKENNSDLNKFLTKEDTTNE